MITYRYRGSSKNSRLFQVEILRHLVVVATYARTLAIVTLPRYQDLSAMPTLADPRMSSLLLDQNYRHISYVIVQPTARGTPTIDRIPGPSKSRLARSVLLQSSASSLARLQFVQRNQWRALFLLIVRIECLRPLCSVVVHHEDLHRSFGQGKGVRLGEEVVVIVEKSMIETSTVTEWRRL